MAKRKRKSPKTEATEPAEKAEAAETEAAEAEAAPEAADEETPAESTAETPGEPEDQPAADPGREETPEGPEEEPDPEALKAEVAELNDKLLRALAEAENVRRRAERDKKDASKYAIANFARDMVGVADNLHRAMAAVDEETRKEVTALDQMMVGLELTEREILNTFERFGITKIEALGKKFDHNFHEAMFEIDDDQKPAGTVIQVVETGYVLNDRLLKPAKVGVAKGGPPANPEETDQAGADETPQAEAARKDGQTAYETKGKKPGAQLDEEL